MNDSEHLTSQARHRDFGKTLRFAGGISICLGLALGLKGNSQASGLADKPRDVVDTTLQVQGGENQMTNGELFDVGEQVRNVGIGIAIGGVISTVAGVVLIYRNPAEQNPQGPPNFTSSSG